VSSNYLILNSIKKQASVEAGKLEGDDADDVKIWGRISRNNFG